MELTDLACIVFLSGLAIWIICELLFLIKLYIEIFLGNDD